MSDSFELGEFERQPEERPEPVVGSSSSGIAWGVIFFFTVIGLMAAFVVQNTDPIPVRFLWMEGEFPLSILVLVLLAACVLLTEMAGFVYRRRRRRRRAEKVELKRLRET